MTRRLPTVCLWLVVALLCVVAPGVPGPALGSMASYPSPATHIATTVKVDGQPLAGVERPVDSRDASGMGYDQGTAQSTNHRIWDDTIGGWVEAGVLKAGHLLHTDNGAVVTVTDVHSWTASQLMWDLTVATDHDFFVVAGSSGVLVHNCGGLPNIPDNAEMRGLTPSSTGGAQYGVEYKWTNDAGQTVRFRVHGPDSTAPAGSNAAAGDVWRLQVGGRYADANGTLHPRGISNPRSPNYDPAAINATHIPFPGIG